MLSCHCNNSAGQVFAVFLYSVKQSPTLFSTISGDWSAPHIDTLFTEFRLSFPLLLFNSGLPLKLVGGFKPPVDVGDNCNACEGSCWVPQSFQ